MKRISIFVALLCSAGIHAQNQCASPSEYTSIDINQVDASITNKGSQWNNNFSASRYEVPKGEGTNSLYHGGLWIAGMNGSGQLVSAVSSFQCSDYYPGPLDTTSALTGISECAAFNRVWNLYRWQVEEFIQKYNQPGYTIPEPILNWPAHGNTNSGQANNLAPFHDVNGDGIYDPYAGDYPEIDVNGTMNCEDKLLGDQFIYYIINDTGGDHYATGGTDKFGFEIHVMVFSYIGDNAMDYTTFYRYQIINRSNVNYSDTYLGLYIDTDIGCAVNDFIGSDPVRGLAYGYNGTAIDNGSCSGSTPYLDKVPAIGFDFVRTPLAENDGLDNDFDGMIDESGERLDIATFKMNNSSMSATTLYAASPVDAYNLLSNKWRDGTDMLYGGNGHLSGTTDTTKYPFMFPRYSDTANWYTNNQIDPGYLWDESTAGNPPGDRSLLTSVGPFDIQSGEMKSFTMATVWARDTTLNNVEQIQVLQAADDTVQQIADNCFDQGCVSPRPQFFHDVQGQDVSFDYPFEANSYSWDFGDGNTSTDRFPDHTYSAYGTYNVCVTVTNNCGTVSFCDSVTIDAHGMLNSPHMTRIEGYGNEGNWLELSDSSKFTIMSGLPHAVQYAKYSSGATPVRVSVYDPNAVVAGKYVLALDTTDASANWKLWIDGLTDTVYSAVPIGVENDQYIPQWGLIVSARDVQTIQMGSAQLTNFLGSQKLVSGNDWLGGVADTDQNVPTNWIGSGSYQECFSVIFPMYNDYLSLDSEEEYENIFGGTWAPYTLCRVGKHWPISEQFGSTRTMTDLQDNPGVDIVLTSDQSKWTRCMVIEMQEDPNQAIGNQDKMRERLSPSVDKNGNPDGTGMGMGWFPGYAIDVETGVRLNMAFGENSADPANNGDDMIWNPTEEMVNTNGDTVFGGKHVVYVFRDQKRLFPTADRMPHYDEGQFFASKFGAATAQWIKIWRAASWVGYPMLKSGQTLLDGDIELKIRVSHPHDTLVNALPMVNNGYPLYEFFLDPATVDVEEEATLAFNLFPNPTTNQVTITLDKTMGNDHEIMIHNMVGQVVFREENVTTDRISIDCSTLETGVYLVTVRDSQENVSMTKRLVITR